MKPKYVIYYGRADSELDVDTGFMDTVEFSATEAFMGTVGLKEKEVKELVLQLTTWLGYKAMENG